MKENFEEMVQAYEALEREREQWREEEATAQKQIAALRTQLAAKAREVKRVEANERAAMEELRVRGGLLCTVWSWGSEPCRTAGLKGLVDCLEGDGGKRACFC